MKTVETATAPYMLFFRNTGPENIAHLSAEERQQFIARWNTWYDALINQGKVASGQPLEMETRIVSGPGGNRVVDGPFPEAKEAIGGYVMLHVHDLDEATAIAQGHPGLDYGFKIEIRQWVAQCHLGLQGHRASAKPQTANA
ncbi:YciI family protein [Oleiharenicola lentus]|uniref:YciI family protein n=1 Tax=Oleiharenicola lentus TaxID=2508720 RepID=UPI003F66F78B